MKNIMDALRKNKELGILAIIIILSILITIINSSFLTFNNIFDVLKSNSFYGIMAFGMLPVLLSGGIDLSVSSTIALCAVVSGNFMKAFPNSNMAVTILVSLAVGALVGVINGLIITKIKIPPIVATLGTQTIILAGVLLYTNGEWISGLPDWFSEFGEFRIGHIMSGGQDVGVYSQILLLIAATIITWLLLRYTLLGRSIYAVGGNAQSAMRVGYHVDRILIFIYMYSGLMCGLAAIANTSIVGQIDPNTYLNYEMDVIAIVVLGGASLTGGIGSVFGTVLGVILMAVIKNGLVLARVSTYYQKIVMGIIILVTISIDAINRKIREDKMVRVDVDE